MKRTICLLTVFALILSFSACSSTTGNTVTTSTDDNGDFTIQTEGRNTIMPKSLPSSIGYNDSSVSLVAVDAYELCMDYEYYLYIIAKLDLSDLTEAEAHWLLEEDLTYRAYITSEKNNLDFDTAPALGRLHLTDSKELYCVFTSSFFDHYRYSFAGSSISVCFDLKQEATHEYTNKEGDTANLNNSNEIHYAYDLPSSLPSTDEIPYYLEPYISKWLNNKAAKLS